MDAIVTARVPVEIKEQVTAILSEIGSSPTKLINAAYEYVLHTRQLPAQPAPAPTDEVVVRRISPQQREELDAFVSATTLNVSPGFWEELGDRSYKEALAEWRMADYETLH